MVLGNRGREWRLHTQARRTCMSQAHIEHLLYPRYSSEQTGSSAVMTQMQSVASGKEARGKGLILRGVRETTPGQRGPPWSPRGVRDGLLPGSI